MQLSKQGCLSFQMTNNPEISKSTIPIRLLTYTIHHRIRLHNACRVIILENVAHVLSAIGPSSITIEIYSL